MTSHQTANQLGVCNQQHSVSLVATGNKMLHWQQDLTQMVRYIYTGGKKIGVLKKVLVWGSHANCRCGPPILSYYMYWWCI